MLRTLAKMGAGSLPNLIVIDINLPRANGYEVLKHLIAYEIFRRIPIVVVTSSRQETERKNALSGGADAFFCQTLRSGIVRSAPRYNR
jgi:CheY-like chemotaxis protein